MIFGSKYYETAKLGLPRITVNGGIVHYHPHGYCGYKGPNLSAKDKAAYRTSFEIYSECGSIRDMHRLSFRLGLSKHNRSALLLNGSQVEDVNCFELGQKVASAIFSYKLSCRIRPDDLRESLLLPNSSPINQSNCEFVSGETIGK